MDLAGMDLSRADLRGAKMNGVSLEGATLSTTLASDLVGCPAVLPGSWKCVTQSNSNSGKSSAR